MNVDSMWRKNRRDGYGVDLNRNYGYQWGNIGASDDKEDETYHGTKPFSEPETQAIRNLAEREHFYASISFHSYGNLILYPFGYTNRIKTSNDTLFLELAQRIGKIIDYTPQRSADLYPTGGDSDDYLYTQFGTLSFTIELGTQFVPDKIELSSILHKNLKASMNLIENRK